MQLALGTVQFGLAYGVGGSGQPVRDQEARAILARAWELGIRRLDTAPGYGDIEERLTDLMGNREFAIVSKIPALPSAPDRAARAQASIAATRARLGARLCGLLFHSAQDLASVDADDLWAVASQSGVPIGPSCYEVGTLEAIARRFPVGMAQLPGNALDQSVVGLRLAGTTEVTLRSAFLQGLLLLPQEVAARRVPAAEEALRRFHAYCSQRGLSPLVSALAIVRGFAGVDYCVVGVESVDQLDEIAAAWEQGPSLQAPQLDTPIPEVIDPRRWSKAEYA